MGKTLFELDGKLDKYGYLRDLDKSRKKLQNSLDQGALPALEGGKNKDATASSSSTQPEAAVQSDQPHYQAYQILWKEIIAKIKDSKNPLDENSISEMDTQLHTALEKALLEFHGIFQDLRRAILLRLPTHPLPEQTHMMQDERIYNVLNGIPVKTLDKKLDALWEHMKTCPQPLDETLGVYSAYVTTGSIQQIPTDSLTDATLRVMVMSMQLEGKDDPLHTLLGKHSKHNRHHENVLSWVEPDLYKAVDMSAEIAKLNTIKDTYLRATESYVKNKNPSNQAAFDSAWKEYLLAQNAVYTKLISYAAAQLQIALVDSSEEHDKKDERLRELIHGLLDQKVAVYYGLKEMEPGKYSEDDAKNMIGYLKKAYPTVASLTSDFSPAKIMMELPGLMTQMYRMIQSAGSNQNQITNGSSSSTSLQTAAATLKEKYQPKLSDEQYQGFCSTVEAYDVLLKTGKAGQCPAISTSFFKGLFGK